MAGMFNTYLAGFTLVCFVLGLLVSHPKTSVNMNAMFPKLSGENAYSLMALLGTNIIVHSFYTHSSVVQVSSNISSPCLVIIARWHISRYIWCALNWFFFHSFSAYLICLGVVYHVLIEMSYTQVQRRFPVLTLGSLLHDHFFSIVLSFSGIFLVNYILLSSAADESKNAMAIHFQEAVQLMNEVCVSLLFLSV